MIAAHADFSKGRDAAWNKKHSEEKISLSLFCEGKMQIKGFWQFLAPLKHFWHLTKVLKERVLGA